MVFYGLGEHSLPEFPWPDVTACSVQSSLRNTIKLANADGTFTVLHGLGFALDGAGEPSADGFSRSSTWPPMARP